MQNKKILLLIFLLAFVKSFVSAKFGINLLFDDNQEYLNGSLINLGDQIYKDFHSFFPIGSDYQTSLFLRFSSNIVYLRYIHALIFCFLPVLVYVISCHVSKNRLASFLSSLIFIVMPVRNDLYFLHTLLLLSLFAFLKWTQKQNIFLLFLAGLPLSITILFRYDFTFYVMAGISASLFFYNLPKFSFAKKVLLINLAPLLSFGLFLQYLHKRSLVVSMFRQTLEVSLVATKYLRANLLFPNLSGKSFAVLSNTLFESLLYWFFLLTFILSVYYFFKNKNYKSENKYILTTTFASTLLAATYVMGNMDIGHLLKGWTYLSICIGFVYVNIFSRSLKFAYLVTLISLLAVSFTRYVWWVNFNDQLLNFGEKGKFYLNNRYYEGSSRVSANTYYEAYLFLKDAQSEHVFVAPYMGSLYYFSGKLPASMYANILAGNTYEPYGEDYIIDSLKEKDVDRIVYDPCGGRISDQGGMSKFYPKLHNHIIDNYNLVSTTQEGWMFLERKK